jgi:hypothetical protein
MNVYEVCKIAKRMCITGSGPCFLLRNGLQNVSDVVAKRIVYEWIRWMCIVQVA